jgi:hypothetical protein
MRVKKQSYYDELGHEYNHVIRPRTSKRPVFAMNARRKHNLFLVSEIVELEFGNFYRYDLLNLDLMLVPTTCGEDDHLFFSCSDFALFLDRQRGRMFPHWNAYLFADYFLTRYRFNWNAERYLELGDELRSEHPLPVVGWVRESFMKHASLHIDRVRYTHMGNGDVVETFGMFDTRQIHFQVMFRGDHPSSFHDGTPEEFRKPVVLVQRLTDRWDVVRFPSIEKASPFFYADIIVTMVVLSGESTREETRITHPRFVTHVRQDHLELNEPVVCVFSSEDTVFFECDIPLLGIKFQYVGYRVLALHYDSATRAGTFACEIKTIFCMDRPEYVRDMTRTYFAVKTIQRMWRECVSNPAFVVCRRRLLHEWGEFQTHLKPLRLTNP